MDKTLVIREVDPSVRELVAQNDGYCPCAVVKTPDTKCMCTEFKDQNTEGLCHCGRYGKVRVNGEYLERTTLLATIENLKQFLNCGIARRNLRQKDILEVIKTLPAERVASNVPTRIVLPEYDEWYCEFGKCIHCGTKIPVFSKYCLECGAKVTNN